MSKPGPALLSMLLMLTAACGSDEKSVDVISPGSPTAAASTFDRIQAEILTPSCATSGCHAAGSAGAVQSGLVLDAAHSYQALVGAPVSNVAARSDGMLRIAPSNPDQSFAYWKLQFLSSPEGRDYGAPMPSSGVPLTNGQIEYIRRWIAAGAPRTGQVADTSVLSDHTRMVPGEFTALAPPVNGFQLHIEPFTVAPAFERELFVYKSVGNTTDVFVNRIETKMRPGSHHLLAYTFDAGTPSIVMPKTNIIRDIRRPDGSMDFIAMIPMAYHTFFSGSMTQTSDYSFPAGVALRVPAGQALDLNAHYVNHGSAPITGEAFINLYTTSAAQVQHEARTLNMPNTAFTLPAHQRTTITKSFTLSAATTTIFVLTSHMHKHGEKFVIRIKGGARDGEVVYTNTDWEHPLIQNYVQPIVLKAGEGLTSQITYMNDTDQAISFGLTSEDEMGIIFGYYY